MLVWLLFVRSKICNTRFLYLLKAAGVSNIDSIRVKGVTNNIAKRLTRANIMLYKLISFVANIHAFSLDFDHKI